MPIPPTTWLANVPVTAGQLNQDLYTYDGSYFAANGVMFHANRPICQETYFKATLVGSSPNGQWVQWGGVKGEALGIVDNSALYGIGCDSPAQGAFFHSSGVTAVGSSGTAGLRGGWVLMITFLGIGNFSSATKPSMGVGWFIAGSPSVNDVGTIQPGSNVKSNSGFAINMFNVGTATGYYNPGSWVADAGSKNFTAAANTANSCGEVARFSQIWCGVNTNGTTVATVPTPQTVFTSTTPITNTLMNSTIQQSLQILNYPPMLNCAGGLSASIPNNTPTIAPFASGSVILDSYGGYSSTTHFYTVKQSGVYFVHANMLYASTLSTGTCAAGFTVKTIGGSNFSIWGGNYNITTNTNVQNGCPITRVLDLQAGDQIAPFGFQLSTAAGSFGSMFHSHFILTWLGALAPASTSLTWTPPEVTGQLLHAGNAPGTQSGEMVPLFNSKIANDLNFLINRPYLINEQTVSQTGLTPNVFHTVVMNTVPTGPVHGTTFDMDNYNGWVSGVNNNYTAQAAGWYLVTAELSLTPGVAGSIMSGILCPVSGGLTAPTSNNSPPDWYQEYPATTVVGPSAATACGLYYLLPGETVAPQIQWQPNSGTVATSTDVTNYNSTFSAVWISN